MFGSLLQGLCMWRLFVKTYSSICRILLVDDDPADHAFWADILQSHGCIIQEADNGEDALGLAGNGSFDCVLLDVMIYVYPPRAFTCIQIGMIPPARPSSHITIPFIDPIYRSRSFGYISHC